MKIKFVYISLIFTLVISLNVVGQEVSNVKTTEICESYPTVDEKLDQRVQDFAKSYGKFNSNLYKFYSNFTREQTQAIILLINSNQQAAFEQYPKLNSTENLTSYQNSIDNYQAGISRILELYPRWDSIVARDYFINAVLCFRDKNDIFTDNEGVNQILSQVAKTDCVKKRKRCIRNADDDYFWCCVLTGISTVGGTAIGGPAGGYIAATIGISTCANDLRKDLRTCEDGYHDCLEEN